MCAKNCILSFCVFSIFHHCIMCHVIQNCILCFCVCFTVCPHVSSAQLFVFIIVFVFVIVIVIVFVFVFVFVSASQCVLHVSSAQLGAGNLKTGMGHISLPSYKSSLQDSSNTNTKKYKYKYKDKTHQCAQLQIFSFRS